MRILSLALLLSLAATPAVAQTPAAPARAPAAATAPKYTSAATDIGTLLDDPAAKAILEKHIPGMTTNDQVDMARAMTLKDIQQYSPDDITDVKLAAIDADLAKLSK